MKHICNTIFFLYISNQGSRHLPPEVLNFLNVFSFGRKLVVNLYAYNTKTLILCGFIYPNSSLSGIYDRQFLLDHNIRHNETPGASFQDNGFWFQTMMYAERAMFCNKPYYLNRRDNPNLSVASREKVYCMNEEYAYIRDILKNNSELYEKLIGQFHAKKYGNYLFRYNVIAQEYQEEYMCRMAEEFKKAIEDGEFDESLLEPADFENLKWIMNDPHDYYEYNNSSTPSVSVIIPVYNTAPFLMDNRKKYDVGITGY